MTRSRLHSIIAPILAMLLLFAATPKDFLHDFTGHEDTVHAAHDDDGSLGIGNQHHHCSFLTLLAMPFEGVQFSLAFVPRTLLRHEPVILPELPGEGRAATAPATRGPPAA